MIAAEKQGCVGPFSSFVNSTLDLIFTAIFGIVGTCLGRFHPSIFKDINKLSIALDMILLICVAVVAKDRKERERYRLIDAKVGLQAI